MLSLRHIAGLVLGALAFAGIAPGSATDHLRNVKPGQVVPSYRLPTVDGKFIDNSNYKGEVVVLVYLTAEQRSSELAAAESDKVYRKFKDFPVRMVHVTADVVHKPYFDRLRAEQGIEVPLGLDASRKLYGELGLIVFPTTIISNTSGKLVHVISTRGPEYPRMLEAYIYHALGEIDDVELQQRLKAKSSQMGSPKSLASRHRAAARLLREKGLIEDARRELTRAMELDPTDTNIRLDLADIDLSNGAYAESLELSRAVLADSPQHRRAKQLAGIAMFNLGEVEQARNMLTEALVLNPNPARVLYYLGRIDEAEGKTQEALRRYREAAERLLDM